MRIVQLEDWSTIVPNDDGCTAPELLKTHLAGVVKNHPRVKDGNKVITAAISKVNGRLITTASGTIYALGKPSKEYLQWLADQKIVPPTEDCPIRVRVYT